MDISRSQMDLKKDTIIKSAQAMQLPQKTSDKTWKLDSFHSCHSWVGTNMEFFKLKFVINIVKLRAAFQPQDAQVLFIFLSAINYIP